MINNKILKTLFQHNSYILPTKNLSPFLFPYILGAKTKNVFLDLSKILPLYKKSLLLIREVFSQRGRVVLVVSNKIPYLLEKKLNNFFIVLKNDWSEGLLTNFSILKKTSKNFLDRGTKPVNKLSGTELRKTRNQLNKFYKKYQTIGFISSSPRLVVSFVPIKNPLFFKELSLLNVPLISLLSLDFKITKEILPHYPIIFNNESTLISHLFLRILLLEAQKGSLILSNKFQIRKLSLDKKKFFLEKVKSIL